MEQILKKLAIEDYTDHTSENFLPSDGAIFRQESHDAREILLVVSGSMDFYLAGKRFAATTLLSTFLYPGFLAVMETMPELATLNTDPIVAAVFGGASIGIGVGLVIRMGSSTGGMDIPPIILQKYTGIAV